MPVQHKTDRLADLARVLAREGIDAFFATSSITMGYLRGFFESGYERFLVLGINSNGESAMICPALSATQAQRCGIERTMPWRDGEDPMLLFEKLAKEWSLRSAVIAVDSDMPATFLLAMQANLPAALFKAGQPILAQLMQIKSKSEIELLQKAATIADRAFPKVLPHIQPGTTELELGSILMNEMKALGGVPTFCIVAAGANSAEPHHHSDSTTLTAGDVVIMDFGCSVEGYQSDITRTVCCGTASDAAKSLYRIVHSSHEAGRRAAVLGAPCQEVDGAARQVIAQAGYGGQFVHRTGHGIGMRGHEEPFIIEGNVTPLQIGHCFSVEPGIYLPGQFGVRIENIVHMTSDGCTSFNEEPPCEIIELS